MFGLEKIYAVHYLLPRQTEYYPVSVLRLLNDPPYFRVTRFFRCKEDAESCLESATNKFREQLPEYADQITKKNFNVKRKLRRALG